MCRPRFCAFSDSHLQARSTCSIPESFGAVFVTSRVASSWRRCVATSSSSRAASRGRSPSARESAQLSAQDRKTDLMFLCETKRHANVFSVDVCVTSRNTHAHAFKIYVSSHRGHKTTNQVCKNVTHTTNPTDIHLTHVEVCCRQQQTKVGTRRDWKSIRILT